MFLLATVLAALAALEGARVRAAPPPMDEEMAELARMVRAECLAQSGARPALVERVNQGAGAPLPDDAALKCYVRCVMETAGMLADGAVDVDAVLALLEEGARRRLEPALRRCGTQPGADACDVAWRTQRCWQQASPADYYLV